MEVNPQKVLLAVCQSDLVTVIQGKHVFDAPIRFVVS
jgi:hypothetical protein